MEWFKTKLVLWSLATTLMGLTFYVIGKAAAERKVEDEAVVYARICDTIGYIAMYSHRIGKDFGIDAGREIMKNKDTKMAHVAKYIEIGLNFSQRDLTDEQAAIAAKQLCAKQIQDHSSALWN